MKTYSIALDEQTKAFLMVPPSGPIYNLAGQSL